MRWDVDFTTNIYKSEKGEKMRALLTLPIIFILSGCSLGYDKGGEEIESENDTDTDSDADTDTDTDTDDQTDPNNVDDDGDGYTENQNDCDDSNSQMNPGANDPTIDGFDQDCDGVDGPDEDNDGYVDIAGGGTDCNDNNPNVNPGAAEDPTDGIDTNCDGISDPGFYAITDPPENVDEYCFGSCDRVAITVDSYRQAHVVYEYDDEIWYNYRTTTGNWDGFESVVQGNPDTVSVCENTCYSSSGSDWNNDGYCDDGGPNSDFNICPFGTDCGDCGTRETSGGTTILGVAGMDAKIDSRDRVQVAYTEEGSAFTSLQYLYRETSGTWSSVFEIDGPTNENYNVGADVAMDIDSNDEPSFVYYNGESGTPDIYDMNGELLSSVAGIDGVSGSLDVPIPEIDITSICLFGYCMSDIYGSDVVGGYSGLYNSIIIDQNNDAHASFYNHNEIQEMVYFVDQYLGSFIGLQTVVNTVNNFVGFDVVGTESGTLNQYSSLSISDITSVIMGGGGYCYNNKINDGQNIFNSMAIKTDGTLCNAYFDASTQQLKYACNSGTCDSWPEEVITSVNVGGPPSSINARDWPAFENRNNLPKDRVKLAFNTGNEPYVVYHNDSSNTLNIALKENGTWETYTIGSGGEQLDIDIDPANYIHIAYIDESGSVRYILGQ
jgi:hypothetical protein